jgi:hypothetical protein
MEIPKPIVLEGLRGREQGLSGFFIGTEFVEAAAPPNEVLHIGIPTCAQSHEGLGRFGPIPRLLVDDGTQLEHLWLQLVSGGELI